MHYGWRVQRDQALSQSLISAYRWQHEGEDPYKDLCYNRWLGLPTRTGFAIIWCSYPGGVFNSNNPTGRSDPKTKPERSTDLVDNVT
jgi:hypothetical protein